MNLSDIFYFKSIVDRKYPDEDRTVDIQTVVDEVKESVKTLSNSYFIEVITSCFIPDL